MKKNENPEFVVLKGFCCWSSSQSWIILKYDLVLLLFFFLRYVFFKQPTGGTVGVSEMVGLELEAKLTQWFLPWLFNQKSWKTTRKP